VGLCDSLHKLEMALPDNILTAANEVLNPSEFTYSDILDAALYFYYDNEYLSYYDWTVDSLSDQSIQLIDILLNKENPTDVSSTHLSND